jgi:hypothetical protein
MSLQFNKILQKNSQLVKSCGRQFKEYLGNLMEIRTVWNVYVIVPIIEGQGRHLGGGYLGFNPKKI